MDRITKALGDRSKGSAAPLPVDPESKKKFPILWDFVTFKGGEGKDARKPARIGIWVSYGGFTVHLVCPSEGVQLFCEVNTLSAAFDALETRLASGEPGWKELGGFKGKKSK